MADRHPLGFIKVDLLRLAGYRLRLHVWLPGVQRREDPHDHRWSFVSVPLVGRFTDRRWRPAPGSDWRAHEAVHPLASHWDILTPGGVAGLELASETTRWPLVPYRCRWGQTHSFVPKGRLAASLVLLGRPYSDRSTVWRAT